RCGDDNFVMHRNNQVFAKARCIKANEVSLEDFGCGSLNLIVDSGIRFPGLHRNLTTSNTGLNISLPSVTLNFLNLANLLTLESLHPRVGLVKSIIHLLHHIDWNSGGSSLLGY